VSFEPSKEPGEVGAMFDRVARRYDLTNSLLSLGQDRGWRRATVEALGIVPGDRVLDVAAGTGAVSVALANLGAQVTAVDLSPEMLAQARRRGLVGDVIVGDAADLKFADAAFDAVTMSFGLRNVADVPAVLRELRRVTRPGGRLVVCEFSQPVGAVWAAAYRAYLAGVLPVAARLVSSDPAAYTYLRRTIKAWPDQRNLSSTMAHAGWRNVRWRNLTGGIVALHQATNPA
jgi:demethylmenaquinone methyltransferase/2-methoxy-6-polyprenyl-1,4-benzoquinol methylase